MKSILFAGIALIIGGAALLGYDHYTYTTQEKVLQIGPITASAEREHTLSFPPILGWLMIAGGACVLILGLSRKG